MPRFSGYNWSNLARHAIVVRLVGPVIARVRMEPVDVSVPRLRRRPAEPHRHGRAASRRRRVGLTY